MSKLLLDRRAVLVAAASSAALAACSNIIGPPEASPLYALDPRVPPARPGPRVHWQLTVALPETPDNLDTDRIVLVQPDNTVDFYANARWPDRIPYLLQSALVEAFESSGRIGAVGRDTEGLRSSYILLTDIRDFHAQYDAADAPPTIEVRIAAKLLVPSTRQIVQSMVAQAEAKTTQNSVPAVAQAFNTALGDAVGQIVGWTLDAPIPVQAAG
ncbi:MAG TPA: ABC-type transport auxiliary lipoprotein family protein [Rhizomicrobium sp.]|nr:ABC-type transport auxiliary lipoprotein family protein [Rhizomicrobium sp.]